MGKIFRYSWTLQRRALVWGLGFVVLCAAGRTGCPSGSSSGAQRVQSSPAAGNQNQEKLQMEIRKYQELVRLHPESAVLWSNLGTFRATSGDCANALPALQRAKTLNANLFAPWFFTGVCYYAMHKDALASQNVEHALRLNSHDVNAWFLKAQIRSDLGDPAGSLEAVGRSLTTGEARPEALYLGGKDGLELAARFYGQVMAGKPQPDFYTFTLNAQRNAAMGVLDQAIQEYFQAADLSGDHPDLFFALGTAYLEKGDYGRAEKYFRRCLNSDPDSNWVRLRLALSLVQQDQKEEAAKVFRTAKIDDLQINSEYEDFIACAAMLGLPGEAQSALTRARQKFGERSEWTDWAARLDSPATPLQLREMTGVGLSFRYFVTSKADGPNIFEALFSDPAAYRSFKSNFLAGRWAEVAIVLETIVKPRTLQPSSVDAYALSQILQCVGLEFYERLAVEFPDSPPAMKLAAENFVAAGQPEKALEIYRSLIERLGPSPDILREEAKIYWTDHRWAEALKVIEPLVQMDPYDATNFVNLGRIYLSKGDSAKAEGAFRRAIQVDPRMMEAHLGLGQVLRGENDLEGAAAELKLAARLAPMTPDPHYQLSLVYNKLGKKDLAAQEISRFQSLSFAAKSEAKERGGSLAPIE
jgi:tetratricopeptide (TPR) repeat protein